MLQGVCAVLVVPLQNCTDHSRRREWYPTTYWDILRDRRPGTTACSVPSLLVGGDKWIEIAYVEENNFLYWAYWSRQKQDKNLLDQHNELNEPKKESPLSKGFHMYSLSPHLPQFNSQQGPSLSGLCAPARHRPQYPYMAKIRQICSVADRDPGFEFFPSWVQDPGSRVKKIPYPGSGSASKNLSI